MKKRRTILCLAIFLLAVFCVDRIYADIDTRKKVIKFLRTHGFSEELNAGVRVSKDASGVVSIADEGDFFMQYVITEPAASADSNVIVEANVTIPASCTKAVIVTHGWLDKGSSGWSAEMAQALMKKVDPNEWVCGYFDWRGGAAAVNPIDSAKYARDIAGPRLGKALSKLGRRFDHIHFIGHSAGCWVIDAAAEIIAKENDSQIHLTFLDAYVPPGWEESTLGDIESEKAVWAEHYYTKDITLQATHENLSAAHNVDITAIDLVFKEHKFPYRWYYATVAGRYRKSDWEARDQVITKYNELDYGFARSAEAGKDNWKKSVTLKKGNEAVKLKKPKKKSLFDFDLFKKKQEKEK